MERRRFDNHVLIDHLGKGGMATVFSASNEDNGQIVAVKIFESNEDRPPETARRLRDREVHMLLSVEHPNIVKFYDMGCVDDDYVRGYAL